MKYPRLIDSDLLYSVAVGRRKRLWGVPLAFWPETKEHSGPEFPAVCKLSEPCSYCSLWKDVAQPFVS